MRTLLHLTTRSEWNLNDKEYRAPSLETEGFIHMSRPHQVMWVANRIFKGKRDLVLLQVSQEDVASQIKYEQADEQTFPHIYGPINRDAVVAVHDFEEGNDGFQFPTGLQLVGDTLIRRGLPGDEAEIASCHTHSWLQSYKGLINDDWLATRPLSFRSRLNWWRSVVEGKTPTTVFVAESREHGIVAFCAVEPARDESMKGKGELAAIYCLDQYKGQHLGSNLFRKACAFLKEEGFDSVYLWVLKNNPTIAFYERMGGRRLEMEKTLDLGGLLTEIAFEWSGRS